VEQLLQLAVAEAQVKEYHSGAGAGGPVPEGENVSQEGDSLEPIFFIHFGRT
jgi:hypothetical protein